MEGLYNGDCLELMKGIKDASIDMILCDLPYGITQNKWDIVIPLSDLWAEYNRIITDNGAIVLTSQGMFSALLMTTNPKMYRYNIIWEKSNVTNFLNANKMPMRIHEEILIFYKSLPIYNPQKSKGKAYIDKQHENNHGSNYSTISRIPTINTGDRHPHTIIKISNDDTGTLHPTQKPVKLMEYLIRTYTNEGNLVLDNCMGSGTTGVACKNLNRRFIGMEMNPEYFNIASKRISQTQNMLFTY